jgi:hypothetical protein
MILSVSSETPHCGGNESQDTIVLLGTVLMSTEREMRLHEAKGFMIYTREDQELMRNMDELEKW